MRKAAGLILAATLTATPATAVLAEATPAAKRADERVCKVANVPNSRFTRRVCMTRSQWANLASEHQRTFSELQEKVHMPVEK